MNPLPLRCPYPGCGSELLIFTFDDGYTYVECANDACNAEWDKHGDVIRASELPEQTPSPALPPPRYERSTA